MALTLGSLFDGSGGFPLAGATNGITPVRDERDKARREKALLVDGIKNLIRNTMDEDRGTHL